MHSLTKNEARAIDFLVRNFNHKNSINSIGKKLGLSPRGAYKILKKLEKMNAIIPERIGNAIYYKINFKDDVGEKTASFVLSQNELSPYSKVQAQDLSPLKSSALCCVLFGSVLSKGREAKDIDVLLILEKKNFKKVHKSLSEIKEAKPKNIHDVMLTKKDLVRNIKKNDDVVLDIIKTGKILWGSELIIEAIKNVAS